MTPARSDKGFKMTVSELKSLLNTKGVTAIAYIPSIDSHVELIKADIQFMIKNYNPNENLDVTFNPSSNCIIMN
jgi:hypothetical protein